MKSKLLGIMIPKRENRKSTLKLYHRCNDLNLAICTFTPEDIDWKRRKVVALFYENGIWKVKKVVLPNVVYNRCYTTQMDVIYRLEGIIGENKCFNHRTQLNKWEVYNILEKTILKKYLPQTYLLDEANLQRILTDTNLIFLKPCYGHKGEGIYRVERMRDGEIGVSQDSLPPRYIYRNDEEFKEDLGNLIDDKNKYIIQQGIPFIHIDNKHFEFRALVQKNINGLWEVSNIVSRVAYESYYNASVIKWVLNAEMVLKTLFKTIIVKRILKELNFISIEAAKELDSKFKSMAEISVDCGIDKKGKLWIVEINGCPVKKIYDMGIDLKNRDLVYKRPLEFAYFLAKLEKRKV